MVRRFRCGLRPPPASRFAKPAPHSATDTSATMVALRLSTVVDIDKHCYESMSSALREAGVVPAVQRPLNKELLSDRVCAVIRAPLSTVRRSLRTPRVMSDPLFAGGWADVAESHGDLVDALEARDSERAADLSSPTPAAKPARADQFQGKNRQKLTTNMSTP
jgi:hypothetical protein